MQQKQQDRERCLVSQWTGVGLGWSTTRGPQRGSPSSPPREGSRFLPRPYPLQGLGVHGKGTDPHGAVAVAPLSDPAAPSRAQAGFPQLLDPVLSSSAFAKQPLYSGSIYRELNNFKSLK